MKGTPLLEIIAVFITAVIFLFPVSQLTRTVRSSHSHSHSHPHVHRSTSTSSPASSEEAWLEIRCSHPPEKLQVLENEIILWEGDSQLFMDADIKLSISETRNKLDFHFRWPESVENAYVEMAIEVGDRPVRQTGFWTQGEDRRSWFLEWEDPL